MKATRLKGIQDFKATAYALPPIAVDTWGHFVFIHLQGGAGAAAGAAPAGPTGVAAWLGVLRVEMLPKLQEGVIEAGRGRDTSVPVGLLWLSGYVCVAGAAVGATSRGY